MTVNNWNIISSVSVLLPSWTLICWWSIGIDRDWLLRIPLLCICNYTVVNHVCIWRTQKWISKQFKIKRHTKNKFLFVFKVFNIRQTQSSLTWTGIGRGLLRIHHDLTMVLPFANFDTHTINYVDNKGQPKDTPNNSTNYRTGRRRRTWNNHICSAYLTDKW